MEAGRPASHSEDYNGAARWRAGEERPEPEYEGPATARREFFDSYAAHVGDMAEHHQMVDPRFAELSARTRKKRVDFVEDNFTARHRFMEECIQRKTTPNPVLLSATQPLVVDDPAKGKAIDLTNYRLGDNLAAALAESLRLSPDPVAALLLANNLMQGLPSEFQVMTEDIRKMAERGMPDEDEISDMVRDGRDTGNMRLNTVIRKAKKVGMPNAMIERAARQGSNKPEKLGMKLDPDGTLIVDKTMDISRDLKNRERCPASGAWQSNPISGTSFRGSSSGMTFGPGELRRDLRDTQILRPSIVAVSDVIRENRDTLMHLDLSENAIGPFGVAMVAEALRPDNNCLEVLRLRRSGIRDRGMMVLGEILQECSCLRVLDLRDCNLGPASVQPLCEALEMSINLEELYLGWNPLQQGAEQVLRALKDNDSDLHTVELQWTGLPDHDGGAVAHALHHAKKLRVLDISHNEIGEKAAMVIAGACKRTRTLKELRMGHNPIGARGGQAMFKMLRVLKEEDPQVDLTGCNLAKCQLKLPDRQEPLLDFSNPAGAYELHLEKPYDAMCAYELLELAWNEEGENMKNETLDGSPFNLAEPDGFKDGRVTDHYRLPDEYAEDETEHLLKLEYESTRKCPHPEDKINDRQWRMLTSLMGEASAMAVGVLEVAASVTYFDVDQAKELVNIIRNQCGNRVEATVPLLSRLVDPINLINLFNLLSDSELHTLKNRVGDDMFHFNPRNPTGHYQLDLATTYDWVVAQNLADLANEERIYMLKNHSPDLSQRGDGEVWRNASHKFKSELVPKNTVAKPETKPGVELETLFVHGSLDPIHPCGFMHEQVFFDGKFKVPNRGILELDFTSSNRPSKHATPIVEHVLTQLVAAMTDAANRVVHVPLKAKGAGKGKGKGNKGKKGKGKKGQGKGKKGGKGKGNKDKKKGGKKDKKKGGKKGKKGKKGDDSVDESAVSVADTDMDASMMSAGSVDESMMSESAAGSPRPSSPNDSSASPKTKKGKKKQKKEKEKEGPWAPEWDAEDDGLENMASIRSNMVDQDLGDMMLDLTSTGKKLASESLSQKFGHSVREIIKAKEMTGQARPVWWVPLDEKYTVRKEKERLKVATEHACEILRRSTFVFYFTATQCERIISWFPPENRVEPYVILFCRCIDLENLSPCNMLLTQPIEDPPTECLPLIKVGKPCTQEEFTMRTCEFLDLFRRLGALHLFNPYDPDYRWELDCLLGVHKDERKVINILVLLEQKESGENWLNESREWLKFDAPANWVTDEGLPHKGCVRVSYNTEMQCADAKLRSGLAKYCAVGKGKGYCIPDEKRKGGAAEREEARKIAEAVAAAGNEDDFRNALAMAHGHGHNSDDDDFDPFATKKKYKKIDPLSWKTIDVYDIVREALTLRDCIANAVGDGDVDKQELREIIRILAKSGHPQKTRDRVYEALGDNDMDEEDQVLLESLIPPDAKNDWDETIAVLEQDRGFLTTVFRFYGTQGGGSSESADIGADEWRLFCKCLKLPASFRKSSIDNVFTRANQDRSPQGVDYFVLANLEAAQDAPVKDVAQKDNQMEIKEFVAGVIRLAQAVYPTLISMAARLQKLIEEHIRPQCTKVLQAKDDVSEMLEHKDEDTMFTVLQMIQSDVGKVLYEVFKNYAEADNDGPQPAAGPEPTDPLEETDETINEKEFLLMLSDGNLIDNKLTKREVRQIFLKVNLDDDIAGDEEGGEVTSSGSELDFDEFIEVVVRIAVEKRGEQVEKTRNGSTVGHPAYNPKEPGMNFESMVAMFVTECIAPLVENFTAAAKGNKKGRKY